MALIDKLSAIGDAIREKTGKDDLLTLDQMPTEIQAIETGGGDLPEEAFVITGECSYRFANNGWNWFIQNYGNKITTKDISSMSNMFSGLTLERIPFDLNGKQNEEILMSGVFKSNSRLTSVPKINNVKPRTTTQLFTSCYRLREIPDDIDANWDWSYLDNNTSGRNGMFSACYSLRKYPNNFLNHGGPSTGFSSSIYISLFDNCYVLDEVIDLPVLYENTTWTGNAFSSTVSKCNRLKNFTFALQEDGTPYQRNWRNQVLDFSMYTGWVWSADYITTYNSGITTATRIVDDESYQLLKDHPDSWTTDIAYSRYNKESAIRTIASLPDCSAASGTNTIKFKGPAGSKTDGGAINTLDNSQIAIAAAKKWTVAFVN